MRWSSLARRSRGDASRRAAAPPDALFLSTAAAANHSLLAPLYEWFHRNLLSAVVANRSRQAFTVEMLDRGINRERILTLLRAADLGIVDARKLEVDPC